MGLDYIWETSCWSLVDGFGGGSYVFTDLPPWQGEYELSLPPSARTSQGVPNPVCEHELCLAVALSAEADRHSKASN